MRNCKVTEKIVKQKIEDVINDTYIGDALKNAIDFISHLSANKISLSQESPKSWKASFKGKISAIVILSEAHLVLSLRGDYSKDYESVTECERMKHCLLDNLFIKPCNACNAKCSDGIIGQIFGMEFNKVCKHLPNTTYFNIVDIDAVECAKLIIEKRCHDIITA